MDGQMERKIYGWMERDKFMNGWKDRWKEKIWMDEMKN